MLQMRIGELLLFELRQLASRRDCVTDLSTVHIMLGQVVDVICEIFVVYELPMNLASDVLIDGFCSSYSESFNIVTFSLIFYIK